MNDIIRNKRIKEFIKTRKDKKKDKRNQELDSVENVAEDTVSETSKRTVDIVHFKRVKASKTGAQEPFETNANKNIQTDLHAPKRKYGCK